MSDRQYPAWVTANLVDELEVVVNGQPWTCPVLKRQAGGGFDQFMGFSQPNRLAFVSEAVPVPYRPLVLRHEIVEFTILTEVDDRCLAALREELQHVALDHFAEYIRWREGNFRQLLDHIRSHPQGYPPTFIGAIERNIKHLESLS